MAENDSRPDRKGLKTVVIYVEPDTARELKMLALTQGITMQELGHTALSDYASKHRSRAAKAAEKVFSAKG